MNWQILKIILIIAILHCTQSTTFCRNNAIVDGQTRIEPIETFHAPDTTSPTENLMSAGVAPPNWVAMPRERLARIADAIARKNDSLRYMGLLLATDDSILVDCRARLEIKDAKISSQQTIITNKSIMLTDAQKIIDTRTDQYETSRELATDLNKKVKRLRREKKIMWVVGGTVVVGLGTGLLILALVK